MNDDFGVLVHDHLLPAVWWAWLLYWWLSSRDVKATERQESALSRLLHLGPMVVAAILLWAPALGVPPLDARWLPRTPWAFWLGALVTIAGLGFSVRARQHLGRNWSAVVTLKAGHELVTSGPYALVRHPIYTGLLLGFLGSAIARGHWSGLLATALFFLAALRKYRLEERWMRERFGADYAAYQARVKAIVPFVL
jgi:protein-S-isoprenylcysteine O-methyltransferase Ste14